VSPPCQLFCFDRYRMPRNVEFDVEAARSKIMQEFWKKGYEGTSLTDLEGATSLVRTSLYNTFGNKTDMFLDSLKLYHEQVEKQIDDATRNGGAEVLANVIVAMMEGQGKRAGEPAGCLMVNAATQSDALDARQIQHVRDYRKMLVSKAKMVLDREQSSGRVVQDFGTESAAEFLICLVWGALAAQCLNGDDKAVASGGEVLRATIKSWLVE